MANINSEVLSKSTNTVNKSSGGSVTLTSPNNVVKLHISPNDVQSYSKSNNDLIIQLKDGSTFTIANFYDGSANELVLDDGREVSLIDGLGNPEDGSIVPLGSSHDTSWPVILASIVAGGFVISRLLSDNDNDNDSDSGGRNKRPATQEDKDKAKKDIDDIAKKKK